MFETVDTDVCVVGAGIAGLFAAWALPSGVSVAVLDKGVKGEGSSPLAQGGMAAAVGSGDSPERHLADTVAAGAGLVDEATAGVLCREAPERVRDLIDLGCRFDTEPDGALHLAREGGQSVARSVHRADATGAEIVRALREAVTPRVRRIEAYAFRLAVSDDGECAGAWAIGRDGGTVLVRAGATLLSTGGAGALFASTTNPPAATGDGLALAQKAGATLQDLEFVQFHPTALAVPESPRPLLTEALRGAGAVLVDRAGTRFMPEVHADAELAPRHVVTAAIIERGEAFLDCRGIGENRLEREFPTVVASCRARGFDPAADLLPVAPAAHYQIGGVATDDAGRTTIPRLFAAGECAATGVHGANRMAGNSLSEAVVFARRAAEAISGLDALGPRQPEEPQRGAGAGPDEVRSQVVRAVTEGAGPIRDAERASRALERLDALAERTGEPGGRSGIEAATTIAVGRMLVAAALRREETRGVHVRSDFPEREPALDGVHLRSGEG